MPFMAALPVILVKSALLATAAGVAAQYFGKINLLGIFLSIVAYQLIGSGIEWIILRTLAPPCRISVWVSRVC